MGLHVVAPLLGMSSFPHTCLEGVLSHAGLWFYGAGGHSVLWGHWLHCIILEPLRGKRMPKVGTTEGEAAASQY